MAETTPRGIYRVRVSHADADHHMNAEAYYGPAFDAHYQHTAASILGVDNIDLLAEARKCAERCRAEHPDTDGYTTKVVELHDTDIDEAGDPVGEWVEAE